jgi:hypothetical protein
VSVVTVDGLAEHLRAGAAHAVLGSSRLTAAAAARLFNELRLMINPTLFGDPAG